MSICKNNTGLVALTLLSLACLVLASAEKKKDDVETKYGVIRLDCVDKF